MISINIIDQNKHEIFLNFSDPFLKEMVQEFFQRDQEQSRRLNEQSTEQTYQFPDIIFNNLPIQIQQTFPTFPDPIFNPYR